MSTPITHERAFELLPWIVNGSLAMNERDEVERHLRDCLLCRRELKEQQRLRSAVLAQPAVHVSAQSGFDKLLQRIDAPPAPVVRPRHGASAWWTPAFARFAVVGAAGAVLLAGLLWLSLPSENGALSNGDYRTLASSPRTASRELDVVFVDSITAAQMQDVLTTIGGEVTSGPSDIGRYTVRLSDRQLTDAELAELAERLRADPRVRFAAASMGGAVPQ